ncbi:MAG: response regulator transcription factor, partial [bacterium]|nr:response regulator transcription factor [bacterium]
ARSYLLKDMSTEEIAGTIRGVHQGSTEIPQRIAERLAERAQRQSLSRREQEVLHMLVRGRSNKEIGAQLFISEETVKSHLKTLFMKLKVRDRTDAVISAVRHGIVHL